MAKAKAPEPEQGRFCPLCKATLKLSRFNRLYCPNVYPDRSASEAEKKAFKPCQFKGRAAETAAVINTDAPIAPLANPSDEQRTIMERCLRWRK